MASVSPVRHLSRYAPAMRCRSGRPVSVSRRRRRTVVVRSRILIGLLAGTLGGFLGWLLQENLINYNAHIVKGILPGQGAISQSLSIEETRTLIYCVGGLIGLCLGAVEGIVQGNVRK